MTNDYFALLRDTIEAMDENPSEIRRAIYEVARHQLEKQLLAAPNTSLTQARQQQNALDAAIRRIDTEVAQGDPNAALSPPQLKLVVSGPTAFEAAPAIPQEDPPARAAKEAASPPLVREARTAKLSPVVEHEGPADVIIAPPQPPEPSEPAPAAKAERRRWRPGRRSRGRRVLWFMKVVAAAIVGGIIAGAGGYALMQTKSGHDVFRWPAGIRLPSFHRSSNSVAPAAPAAEIVAQAPAPKVQPPPPPVAPPAPASVAAAPSLPAASPAVASERADLALPEVYGVYALQDGKLTELNGTSAPTPERRQPPWIVLKDPPRIVFPHGRLAFVVFRRALISNAPERVIISVVARVAQETTTSPNGQVQTAPVANQWVVRRAGPEFRVAPIKGQPEMILIRPDSVGFSLPAGRYAVMVGDQAFDFAVEGAVNDTAHCVDRTVVVNATVYSECMAGGGGPPARGSR